MTFPSTEVDKVKRFHILLFTCTAYPCFETEDLWLPFIGEEVTAHNPGTSLLLSTSVWVLLSHPIERRETRPTA